MRKLRLFSLFGFLAIFCLLCVRDARAQETETPTPTATSTHTLVPMFPSDTALPTYDRECNCGHTPVGWGSETPAPQWWDVCGDCYAGCNNRPSESPFPTGLIITETNTPQQGGTATDTQIPSGIKLKCISVTNGMCLTTVPVQQQTVEWPEITHSGGEFDAGKYIAKFEIICPGGGSSCFDDVQYYFWFDVNLQYHSAYSFDTYAIMGWSNNMTFAQCGSSQCRIPSSGYMAKDYWHSRVAAFPGYMIDYSSHIGSGEYIYVGWRYLGQISALAEYNINGSLTIASDQPTETPTAVYPTNVPTGIPGLYCDAVDPFDDGDDPDIPQWYHGDAVCPVQIEENYLGVGNPAINICFVPLYIGSVNLLVTWVNLDAIFSAALGLAVLYWLIRS